MVRAPPGVRSACRSGYVARVRRLALFARPAVIGKVKTRLSPALPPAAACMLYRGMLADALDALRGARSAEERFVYWADGDEPVAAGVRVRPQSGADLGVRLAAAFDELLAAEGDRAVIFGADCPALDASVIDEAFARLERSALVIAPARDGGYALIGLARRAPSLFHGIAWSTEGVLEQTLERARALGLETARLAPLEDVDTAEDVCRLVAWLAPELGERPSGTRGALRTCGLLPAIAAP